MNISCTLVIPTKDRPGMLIRSVNSALCAIPKDGQIIVVDDHGTIPASVTLARISDSRLYILSNTNNPGVSGARNFGVSHAKGDTIFFLDDDDEIMPDYCTTILDTIFTSSPSPDYGFSSYLVVSDADGHNAQQRLKNKKLPNGLIADSVTFKRKMCGFGVGFWIRKSVFYTLGKIDENLPCNEDTEYSCRLLNHRKKGWFSAKPGVTVHDHTDLQSNELSHVTKRTSWKDRADCFALIMAKHNTLIHRDADVRHHLRKRLTKMLVKSGNLKDAINEVGREPSLCLRIKQYAYLSINMIRYTISKVQR